MAKKVVIFGTGIIGSEAARQYPKHGYEVIATVSSRCMTYVRSGRVVNFKERGNPKEILSRVVPLCKKLGVDLGVYALPSARLPHVLPTAADLELALIMPFLEDGVPVVLAGKAGLSEYFPQFEPYLNSNKMGINATVGGATMMLDEMGRHLQVGNGEDILLELVINGTLSYIMTNVWTGRPLEAVIREAVALKFAEPGINNRIPDPLGVVRGEVEGDVPKKLRIIIHRIFRTFIGRYLNPTELRPQPFDKQHYLDEIVASNERRKFIARISTRHLPPMLEVNGPGSIWANIEGKLFVQAGFCRIPKGSPLDEWVPNSGPGNAARIVQGGRQRLVVADGAGDLATVGTMLQDSKMLCPPTRTL